MSVVSSPPAPPVSPIPPDPAPHILSLGSRDNQLSNLAYRCMDSLAVFVQTFWPIIEPGKPLIWGWYLQAICDHLQAASEGEITHLLICMPPRHLKSSLLSVMWLAWMWTREPWRRGMYGSYDERLTQRDADKTRVIIRSDRYQQLFKPIWKITREQDSKNFFRNTMHGARKTYYVGSRMKTGWGGDHIALDDPLSAESRYNRAIKATCNESFDDVISTRIDDPTKPCFVVCMQRLCLLPGSMIQSDGKVIPIEDIKIGDEVMTTRGIQAVKNAWARQYDGDVVGIRVFGHSDVLWVTPNHQILTTNGWVRAEDMTTDDIVDYRIPVERTTKERLESLWPELPISQPPKRVRGVKLTGTRGRVDKAELQDMVDRGLSSREIAERLGFKHRQHIDNYIAAYGIAKPGCRRFPSTLLSDPDFWRLVGYWIAEGSLGNGRDGNPYIVSIDFNENEEEFINDIVFITKKLGVYCSVNRRPSVSRLIFSSKQIALFLSLFGHKAIHKALPEWAVMLPVDFLRQLLIGYFRGDGCVSCFNDCLEWRLATSSLAMANSIQRAFAGMGIPASVMTVRKGDKQVVINNREVTTRRAWEVRVVAADVPWMGPEGSPRVLPRKNIVDNEGIKARVKSIEVKKYNGFVYDIETPCHDFVSGSIVAHNSEDDIIGFLIDKYGGKYTQLILRTEFDPAKPCRTPIFSDPRTSPGELLNPERYPRDVIEDHKRRNEIDFAAQFNQDPVPSAGNRFKVEKFQYWTHAGGAHTLRIAHRSGAVEFIGLASATQFLTVDPACSEKNEGDFTSIGRWAWIPSKGYLILLHRVSIQEKEPGVIQAIRDVYHMKGFGQARPICVCIESNGPGKPIAQAMAGSLPIREIPMIKHDKVARSAIAVIHIDNGLIFFPDLSVAPWMKDVSRQLATFPDGPHDDDVDMCSLAANSIYELAIPEIRGGKSGGEQKPTHNAARNRFDAAASGMFGKGEGNDNRRR